MRTQYCRQHIKKTAQECDLGDDIVKEVEKADQFCGSNPAFADCATRPIYRLISEKDIDVRNKAILFAENALNEETPTGGKVRERLTEPEIIGFIRKARREIHGEPEDKVKSEKKPEPVKEEKPKKPGFVGCYQPGEMPETDAPCIKPLGAVLEKQINNGSEVVINPVIVPDTLRERPFKTGLQVQQHDKDPLGIDTPAPTATAPVDPVRAAREEMETRAMAFMEVAPQRIRLEAADLMRNHTSWRMKDVLCLGIDALVEKEGKYERRA